MENDLYCHVSRIGKGARGMKAALVCVAFLLWPRAVEACPTCTVAMVWSVYPPLLYSLCVGTICSFIYILIAIFIKPKPECLRGVSKLGCSLIALLVLCVLGMFISPSVFLIPILILYGPVSLLLFSVFAARAWIKSLRGEEGDETPRVRKTVRAIGWAACAICLATVVHEHTLAPPRGPVETVLKWPGTGTSRGVVLRLKAKEPDSIPVYREMVRRSRSMAQRMAAERLAEIGDPAVDGPLLLEAIEELVTSVEAGESHLSYNVDCLRRSHKKLVGEAVEADEKGKQ